MVAKIIINGQDVDKSFDYAIPQTLETKAFVGCRVLVPFGRHNKSIEGVIVEITEKSEFAKLKEISEILDERPLCAPDAIPLCDWIRQKYYCTFNQALRLVLPPRLTTKIEMWISLNENFKTTAEAAELAAGAKSILSFLQKTENTIEIEYGELYENIKRSNLQKSLFELRDAGIVEISERNFQTLKNKSQKQANLAISPTLATEVAEQIAGRAPIQSAMLNLLSERENMLCSDLVSQTDGSYAALKALQTKGYIEISDSRIFRDAYAEKAKSTAYKPTGEQKVIIEHINKVLTLFRRKGGREADGCFDNNCENRKILIRGVTGSGKTEVYLQSIENCIKLGRQAIVLVPEISLTPQIVERFVARFGKRVAVLHSALSSGERFDEWSRILDKSVDVVVGARSAIFAPFDNLGIIILDEEHESSYKSEISPKYHAREVAAKRAEMSNAVLVLASATPSIESFHRARSGEYRLFHMEKRYNDNALPNVDVVDMRAELMEKRNTSVFSEKLRSEIEKNLANGEKTILFLNRRGYSTFVSCRECGHVISCENCSVSLVYHRAGNRLNCHYCGFSQMNVTVCPECASRYIKFFGTGTQKAEEELATTFEGAKVLRMDIDTTSGKGGHESILTKFAEGDYNILLGTQMVTKGLDFPDVTLVGVLAADTSLNIDDFRASERTFAQLAQVAGRAGRGETPGRAVIQTYQPEHYAVDLARSHNYLQFFETEIKIRERLEYPPFCDIVSLTVSSSDDKNAARIIGEIKAMIPKNSVGANRVRPQITNCQTTGEHGSPLQNAEIREVLGPVAAPIARLKRKFRYRILLKCTAAAKISEILEEILEKHGKSDGDTYLSIDINPM